jgi:hypothetical protein
MLDIHLDTVIQSDLSLNLGATNGVTLSQVLPPSSGSPIPKIGKLRGTVQTVGTNQFTIESLDGRTFTINVDSSTTYSDFPSSTTCSTESFACLATGQVVKVLVTLQTDGSLLASEVDYKQPSTVQSVEGNIVGLSTATDGSTTMDLVVQQEFSSSTSSMLPMGHHVRVSVPTTGVTYTVDWNGFTPPTGVALSFASTTDLQVGQQVQVAVNGTVTNTGSSGGSGGSGGTGGPSGPGGPTPVGPGSASFVTNAITLEPSQITGTVASAPTSSLSFTLATLAKYFVPPSPSSNPGGAPPWAPVIITVQTTGATTFTNSTTGLAGLAVNDVVSVDGWVFSTPSGATATTVVADQVVLRPGVAPLF